MMPLIMRDVVRRDVVKRDMIMRDVMNRGSLQLLDHGLRFALFKESTHETTHSRNCCDRPRGLRR